MSKSLGNVYLVKDFIEKGYDPIAYKLFSYSCHYRNKLNFTWEGLEAASKSLERLRNSYQLNLNGTDKLTIEDKEKLKQIEEGFHKAINDDLNMPLAMSFVWEAAKFEKKNPEIAIGNVIGSNLFNIFFVLGCSASITPLHLSGITNFDLFTLVGSGILLWLFGLFFAKRTITRIEGGIMILCYVAYTVVLIYNT